MYGPHRCVYHQSVILLSPGEPPHYSDCTVNNTKRICHQPRPSARMRSEGYCSRPVCVSVCPGLSSATHATTRPSRHTYGHSVVLAPELIWQDSAPILTSAHFYTRNGLIFRIPSVYYALDFTRAVNLYPHV